MKKKNNKSYEDANHPYIINLYDARFKFIEQQLEFFIGRKTLLKMTIYNSLFEKLFSFNY